MIGRIRLIGQIGLVLAMLPAGAGVLLQRAGTVKGAITALAYGPLNSGSAIATGSKVIWDAMGRTPGPTYIYSSSTFHINSIAFSSDGSLLAAAGGHVGRSGEVAIWNISSHRLVAHLTGPVDMIQCVRWRPGKRELAGASYDKSVYLWHIPATGSKPVEVTPYRRLLDHTDAVNSVDFSPDGSRIASAAGDRTVKIWDVKTGKRLITLSESTAELYSVAFRTDGKQVAAGGVDRILRVWNPDSGDLIKSAFAHDGPILKLLYTHDGKRIVSSGEDRVVKLWNADALTESHVFPKQSEWPQALAVSVGDTYVAVGCMDGSLNCYSLKVELVGMSGRGAAGCARPKVQFPPTNGRFSGSRAQQSAPLHPAGGSRISPVICIVDDIVQAQVTSPNPPGVFSVRNETLTGAKTVAVPGEVSGEMWDGKSAAGNSQGTLLSHYYRFAGKRDVPMVIEVMARRAGSPLDSFIQVLDHSGAPIEQAVLRAMGQSEITLFDKDSNITGIRLLPFPDLRLNDYVLIGRELLRVGTLPKGPDDDTQLRSVHGQRMGYLGTSPEYHSIGTKVYRVGVYPAGTKFSPNGMPLTHVMYENDDGGPLYGRDSYLMFTPLVDGEYTVRITDSRSQQGKGYTYKLLFHAPHPDYKISFNPSTVTVPKGGREAVSVECDRYEGFAGPIHVKLEGLPAGFSATETDIEAGENGATLLVSAAPDAVGSTAKTPATFKVVSKAMVDGKPVERSLEPDGAARKLVIGALPGVQADVNIHDVYLRPGGDTAIMATIVRGKGFAGRVPIDVRNLPFGVKVMDVGLNGILVTEKETTRRIVITCEPWVAAQSRSIYLMAGVEGGVGNGAPPLMLHIAPASVPLRLSRN